MNGNIINNGIYTEFNTEEDVDEWANENYGEWLEKLQRENYNCDCNDVADLLYCYTGSMNLIFNKILRGYLDFELEEDELKDFTNKINIINTEISNFKLKENIIVWRYTYKKFFEQLFESNKIKVGRKFIEKSFMSTTLLPKNLEEFALSNHYDTLLNICLTKGTNGAYVDFEKDGLNEREFLLPKGCKFKLIKKKFRLLRWPHYVYECELIG
ncbi:MAG TPA: hypothetical protein DG753_10240 [Clostridium sp.]|nr:hypothetical protein [Clostridium sp.]